MRILYDSKAAQYKTPFGTLRTGENCVLHIYIPRSSGATGVRLVLENCEGAPVGEYPFVLQTQTEDYLIYCCEFSLAERGLYYYWFYVKKNEGGFRLFKQGNGTNMEAGEKWQLSVIPTDFTDYARAQRVVSETYLDQPKFRNMSLVNIAKAGIFSSDRAVEEYAENIWHLK